MKYLDFINIITNLKIKEIDEFEISFVNENDIEKTIKLSDDNYIF